MNFKNRFAIPITIYIALIFLALAINLLSDIKSINWEFYIIPVVFLYILFVIYNSYLIKNHKSRNSWVLWLSFLFPPLMFFNQVDQQQEEIDDVQKLVYHNQWFKSFLILKIIDWIIVLILNILTILDKNFFSFDNSSDDFIKIMVTGLIGFIYLVIFIIWIVFFILIITNIINLKKEENIKIMPSILTIIMIAFIGIVPFLVFKKWKNSLNRIIK
ncbi:MAG: hypothetical protein ACRCVI_02020 [Mycoplasmoidaceae bacterium]